MSSSAAGADADADRAVEAARRVQELDREHREAVLGDQVNA